MGYTYVQSVSTALYVAASLFELELILESLSGLGRKVRVGGTQRLETV